MRKFNKRKLYKRIGKIGLGLSCLTGFLPVAYNIIKGRTDQIGILSCYSTFLVGTILSQYMMNKADEYEEELPERKVPKSELLYNGLIKEQRDLNLFEIYLNDVLYKEDVKTREDVLDSLYYDQILVEKKLEVYDIDESDIDYDEEIDRICGTIDYLESYEKCDKYIELKNKYFKLNRNQVIEFQPEKVKKPKELSKTITLKK